MMSPQLSSLKMNTGRVLLGVVLADTENYLDSSSHDADLF